MTKTATRTPGTRSMGERPSTKRGGIPTHTITMLARNDEDHQNGGSSATSRSSGARTLVLKVTRRGSLGSQATAHPAHLEDGEELLKKGLEAEELVEEVLEADAFEDLPDRQLGALANSGDGYAHTGDRNTFYAGALSRTLSDGTKLLVFGNRLIGPEALLVAANVYETTDGPMSVRLRHGIGSAVLETFDQAESSSLQVRVVRQEGSFPPRDPWGMRPIIDVSIDHQPTPQAVIAELDRLFDIARAEAKTDEGDAARKLGRIEDTLGHYNEAITLAPRHPEVVLYWALNYVRAGLIDMPDVLAAIGWAFGQKPGMREMVRRAARDDSYFRPAELSPEEVQMVVGAPATSEYVPLPALSTRSVPALAEVGVIAAQTYASGGMTLTRDSRKRWLT